MAWTSKNPWTAAEWKAYRRGKGIPPKDNLPTILPPHIAAAGRELTRMMALPLIDWDPGLFVDDPLATTDSTLLKPTDASKCPCGCGFSHNHAVSRVVGENGSRRVIWYRSMDCRNKDKRFDVT